MSPKVSSSRSTRRPRLPGSTELDQLYEYVDNTRKKITLLKPKASAALLEQLAAIEEKLDALRDTPLSFVQSYSLMAEIKEIDEKAEKRPKNFLTSILPEEKEVASELLKVIGGVLLAIIALFNAADKATPAATASPTGISSNLENPPAAATAIPGNVENVAVSFENSNSIDVQVVLKNEDDPRQDQSPIIEAGGSTTFRDLVPGKYTIEVRPRYPEMTLQASNCSVQWQQDESYKGNLVLTSGKTVIQISHFELRPQEICLTITPPASTPTLTP